MPPVVAARPRHVRRIVVGVLGATALAAAALPPALTGVHSGRAGQVAPAPVAPGSGVLFGAHVNPRGADQLTSINTFQSQIGRRLDLVNKYHGFTDRTYKVEAALLGTGRTPVISWRGTDTGTDSNRAAKIAAGQYDATIAATADAVKALPGGVLVRFNWEMDQSPGERQYIGTPSEFVAAWRHVVNIFRAHGATNAGFLWAPRAGAFRKGTAAAFYPGADYVDWIGASAVPTNSRPGFADTFRAFYSWAAPTGKPLLTWAGVRENAADSGYKSGWMEEVATTLPSWPAVKAFVYYHALSPLGYAFWVDTSPQSLSAYKAMGCLGYFDTADACGGGQDPSPSASASPGESPSPSASPSPPPTTGPLRFSNSGLNGAGFQNVVDFSPFRDANGKRPLLIGADIAGIHRSLDGGRSWRPSNVGLTGLHVSSIMFSDVTPGKVYVATDRAINVSTDFGAHWTKRPGQVNFDGNGVYKLNGGEHPRPTGHLLAQDNSGPTKYLYVATASQGVKRSSDDGATWDVVALSGDHLRSIALDPHNPDALYVGDAYKGLQVSLNARGPMTFLRAVGGPEIPEELKFINGKLYVAANTAGIFAYDGSWTALNNGIPTSSAWEAITGYRDGAGRTVIYVGSANPVEGRHTMKSTDGGLTWASVSAGPRVIVSSQEYGQSANWWAADSSYLSFSGAHFVTSDIALDPDDPNTIVIAGRGGARVGVQSNEGVTWWPAVHGLMVTVNNAVVADPKLLGRVYVGNTDYTFLGSDDHATSVSRLSPRGAQSTGDYIALDPDGPKGKASTVYLATSIRGLNTGSGGIYSNPDPVTNPSAWTNENIPVNNDVLAIGIGHSTLGSRIILASITGNGLYRKDGSAWSEITGFAPFLGSGDGTFAWKPGTPVVYAMDGSGVWRSDYSGADGTWVRLITASSTTQDNINSLVLDPGDNDVVYVSSTGLGGIARITGAESASPTVTRILTMSRPGPMVINDSGELFVHDGSGARLLNSSSPRAESPVFSSVGDAYYAENNATIRSMAMGQDGYVYTANKFAGVTVGIPPR